MAEGSLTRRIASRIRRAGTDLQHSIDVLLTELGRVIWWGQDTSLRLVIEALLPKRGDGAGSWVRRATRRLQRAIPLVGGVSKHVTDAITRLAGDLEAASVAAGLGDLAGQGVIEFARGQWETGIRGLTAEAQRSIAAAGARMATGEVSLQVAARDAAAALANRGIHTLRDSRGRKYQPATYVEMALRTQAQAAHTATAIAAANDTGTPYVVVSDHHRECGLCRPWENAVLRIDGGSDGVARASLDTARAAGLFHPNCRHQVHPWWSEYDDLPGPAQPDPIGYAASQKQRALERRVRHQRLLADIEAASGGVSPARRARLDAARRALRDHVSVWDEAGVVKRSPWREVPRPGDRP